MSFSLLVYNGLALDAAKHWEGQVVDGTFPLRNYVSDTGRGAVFLTEHDGRTAVIKLVPADLNADQLSLWQTAAKLSHPNLIQWFRSGRCQLGDQSLIYVVMEYAAENLSQVLPQRPLTEAETREMLEPILSCLTFLHGKGLAHGHLTPANVMAVDDVLKLSSDGLRPIGESATPAADLRSLGALLVEALTQRSQPLASARLPQPFHDIAHLCLEAGPDPQSTLAGIRARLHGTIPNSRWRMASNWGYIALTMMVCLALAAVLVRHKPVTPPPETTRPPATIPPGPKALPPEATNRPTTGPAGPTHRVLPDVLDKARRTIQGRVKMAVRVRVDPSGDVVAANVEGASTSKYFSNLSLQAARRWKFQPADAEQEWILRFEFTRTGTNVSARRVTR